MQENKNGESNANEILGRCAELESNSGVQIVSADDDHHGFTGSGRSPDFEESDYLSSSLKMKYFNNLVLCIIIFISLAIPMAIFVPDMLPGKTLIVVFFYFLSIFGIAIFYNIYKLSKRYPLLPNSIWPLEGTLSVRLGGHRKNFTKEYYIGEHRVHFPEKWFESRLYVKLRMMEGRVVKGEGYCDLIPPIVAASEFYVLNLEELSIDK